MRCTNPERIRRWFLPVSGEVRLGGRYSIEGNASGTIETCDPPRSFTATWEYSGAVSWIEVRLSAESERRTRLELVHIAEEEEHWAQFGPGAVGIGWDLALLGLTLHLRSGEPVDKAAWQVWETSDDCRRFMTLTGHAWGDADVEGGEDPEKARARAQSTIGFYTAAPDGEPAAS